VSRNIQEKLGRGRGLIGKQIIIGALKHDAGMFEKAVVTWRGAEQALLPGTMKRGAGRRRRECHKGMCKTTKWLKHGGKPVGGGS